MTADAAQNSALKNSQLAMARYLRDPATAPPPAGIEPRRLKIYEDLVYNNIASFINSGFPVLHSLYQAADWEDLVRSFMQRHRCHSPYFLEISQEFLQYLLEDFQRRPCDPPFMTELAHYEWVELALRVSPEVLPPEVPVPDLLDAVPCLSPLAWSLAYRYPVHRIGPDLRPDEPGEPTYLVVYRNRRDAVRFMEVNAATARLLELIRENDGATLRALLQQLAAEIGADAEVLRDFGLQQVREFADNAVVLVTEGAETRTAAVAP